MQSAGCQWVMRREEVSECVAAGVLAHDSCCSMGSKCCSCTAGTGNSCCSGLLRRLCLRPANVSSNKTAIAVRILHCWPSPAVVTIAVQRQVAAGIAAVSQGFGLHSASDCSDMLWLPVCCVISHKHESMLVLKLIC